MICESLQSQITNFTAQFFGAVEKAQLAPNEVAWVLPCNLDLGLSEIPRGVDEGVSCYYLRLFRDVIMNLKGADGAPGAAGLAGFSGFTVTLSPFAQPSGPGLILVQLVPNPVIKASEIVYINGSGWYQVLFVDAQGAATLSLIQPMLGATGTISAGRAVVLTGPKGQDIVGPQGATGQPGDKGATGPQGDKGSLGANAQPLPAGAPQQNGSFVGEFITSPVDFVLKSSVPAATLVNFGAATDPTTKVAFKLTVAGVYLFRICSLVQTTADNAVAYLGLVNLTTPASNVSPDPAGTNKFLSGSYATSYPSGGGTHLPVSASCLVTTSVPYTDIQLQAFGKNCRLEAKTTTVSWVRVT